MGNYWFEKREKTTTKSPGPMREGWEIESSNKMP
jgi:hypothetical protein